MSQANTAPVATAPIAVPAPATDPVAAPAPVVDPQLAAKFASLTRKEQAAVKAAAEAKADRALAEKARADAKAIEDKWNGYKGKPEKALDVIKELGLTYDQMTQLYLNGGQPTPEMANAQLQQRIDAIEAQRLKDQEEARERVVNDATAANQKAIADFKTTISEHASDKTKYPLINHFAQIPQIYDLIEGHFNATAEYDADGKMTKAGQQLETPAAAKMIEDYLVDQVKKSNELLAPPQASPAPVTPAQAPHKQPGGFTGQHKPGPSTVPPATAPVTIPSNKPSRVMSYQETMDSILASRRAARK